MGVIGSQLPAVAGVNGQQYGCQQQSFCPLPPPVTPERRVLLPLTSFGFTSSLVLAAEGDYPAAFFYKVCYVLVVSMAVCQVFHAHVHPVTPVVAWV